MDYYSKYIKYKTKYLELKYDNNQYGGAVSCDIGYTNVLGTCWMSALLGILCFGDLTSGMVYEKMDSFNNPSVEKITEKAEKFIEGKITEIQKQKDNKLPAAFNTFFFFSDNKRSFLKTILHKFIERYYNKVMKKPFAIKPENTNSETNLERCERVIAENFLELFKSYRIKIKTFGAFIPHQYLFCNLLSIFFLDYKVSFRNYYNNFSSIVFDDKNDLGILINIRGHVCCLYMCNGSQKFYNDNNKTVYDCEWKELLKESSVTNHLYVKEDGCLIIIDDIISYAGDSKIFKVESLTVISKYITKYTDLDNDIFTFLEFSDIKTIKDLNILTLIGNSYYHNTLFDKAKEMYKLAADRGYIYAQYSFGAMLYNGEGGNKDLKEARKMFELAANQGDIEAQNLLGNMLYTGEGGDKGLKEARKMFELASIQGKVDALYCFGVMLYNGEGGNKDLKEARKMFELAANQGDIEAQNLLGNMLYNGEGGDKDLKEAKKMFELAASQGKVEAQYMLGKMEI
jgi:hypothetical protein